MRIKLDYCVKALLLFFGGFIGSLYIVGLVKALFTGVDLSVRGLLAPLIFYASPINIGFMMLTALLICLHRYDRVRSGRKLFPQWAWYVTGVVLFGMSIIIHRAILHPFPIH